MTKTLTLPCAQAHAYNLLVEEKGAFIAGLAQGQLNDKVDALYRRGYRLAVNTDSAYMQQLQAQGFIQAEE